MDQEHDIRLTEVLTNLALALLTEQTLKADLERLVRLAVRLVPTCSGASTSMLVDGEPTTTAVSDRVTFEVDLVQYEDGEGPCVMALGGNVVRVGFVPDDERFPHFAVGAADRRILSVLSTPIIDHGAILGSLNMYSREPDGFDARAEEIAALIASEAANAVMKSVFYTKARTARDQLQASYDEATVLSRVEGAMMAIHDCSAAQARTLLENAAAANHESLITTAERILSTVTAEEPLQAAGD